MEAKAEGLEHRMDPLLEHRVEDVEAKVKEIKRRLRIMDPEPARRQTRRHHAPSRRSGSRFEINIGTEFAKKECNEVEEKNEKIFADLKYKNSLVILKTRKAKEDEGNENLKVNSKFQKLDVVANHQNEKKEDESDQENARTRDKGSISKPLDVIVKLEVKVKKWKLNF